MRVQIEENYFVDREGRVWNKKGEEKAQFLSSHGYPSVMIWKNNKGTFKAVHRFVAEAFIPNPENKPCVNHIDGNKANNKVDNLEWVTYSENTLHALELGLKVPQQGEDVHNAGITNEQAKEVCDFLMEGKGPKEVSELTGVPFYTVQSIRSKTTWKSVSEGYNFPPIARAFSDATVHWICEQISKGVRNKDIVESATDPKVDKNIVTKIKNKKRYTDISDLYTF